MNVDLQVRRTEMVQPNGDHIITVYSNESRTPIPAVDLRIHPAPRNQRDYSARSLGRLLKIARETARRRRAAGLD